MGGDGDPLLLVKRRHLRTEELVAQWYDSDGPDPCPSRNPPQCGIRVTCRGQPRSLCGAGGVRTHDLSDYEIEMKPTLLAL